MQNVLLLSGDGGLSHRVRLDSHSPQYAFCTREYNMERELSLRLAIEIGVITETGPFRVDLEVRAVNDYRCDVFRNR
jgi:precorrin-6x reductase